MEECTQEEGEVEGVTALIYMQRGGHDTLNISKVIQSLPPQEYYKGRKMHEWLQESAL